MCPTTIYVYRVRAAAKLALRRFALNMAAERVRANALRLPYVEPAPELDVDTGSGGRERRLGKASVYVTGFGPIYPHHAILRGRTPRTRGRTGHRPPPSR